MGDLSVPLGRESSASAKKAAVARKPNPEQHG